MADIIQLLPDSVANQIAAGEVVQRPSSVVKEMVENSLDSGAKQIDVIVYDAGKTSIQIVDDGKGMSETDARMSFERHATSKIRKADDLFSLHTMGFRGEALASIAAVATVELKTRRPEDEVGTSITISGGTFEKQEPISCSVGSNFCVKNLFFNIPARRKFLKSDTTEMNQIVQEFERVALAHPEVGFSLHANGEEVYNLPITGLRQRIVALFGKKINQQLISVNVDTSLISIDGYVGLPETAKKKNMHQFFFVNGRYMRHLGFQAAVYKAYERIIPVGTYVSYFLNLKVDPSKIDVNIHPTKTEIKFENEGDIWQIIAAAIKESLGKNAVAPTIDFDQEGNIDIMPVSSNDVITAPRIDVDPDYNPFDFGHFRSSTPSAAASPSSSSSSSRSFSSHSSFADGSQDAPSDVFSIPSNLYVDNAPHSDEQRFDSFGQDHAEAASASDLFAGVDSGMDASADNCSTIKSSINGDAIQEDKDDSISAPAVSSDYIQLNGKYILSPMSGGLMIIDQHRASTRVIFDNLMQQFETKKCASQKIVFPEMLTVSMSESVILDGIIADLESLGFEISNFGGGSYSISAVPANMDGLNAVDVVNDLLHTAMEDGKDVKKELQEILAARFAERIAIPVGQCLTTHEMEDLVSNLLRSSLPTFTPNGKRVLVMQSEKDLNAMF